MNKPLLSIGMIFRNDIRSLERCLQALEPLRTAIPCELVMADTGSEDGSREVAERYADLVFDFPWVNDFSAARNAVMDRCCGQWYFTVDTDEYLDENVSELVEFLRDKRMQKEMGAFVVQRNYFSRDMLEGEYSDFFALRILRMATGYRYTGSIHEAWYTGGKKTTARTLRSVVLHHDGYAKDDTAAMQAKMDRNLVLLRQELQEEPNNMRRLLQCQDASMYRPQERWSYLVRGMELVEEMGEQAARDHRAAVLYRNAVCAALSEDLPQAEEWLAFGERRMAESIFFRVDVSAAAFRYYYKKEDKETALLWAERYRKGCEEYDAGRYDVQELAITSLLSGLNRTRVIGCLLECEMLIGLERKEDALSLLETVHLPRLEKKADLCNRFLDMLVSLASQEDRAQALCAQLLRSVWDGEEKWAKLVRSHALLLADKLLQKRHKFPAWQLFNQAPGDLGLALKAVGVEQPDQITGILGQVEQWDQVPAQVLAHAVEHCAPFPAAFYGQGEEFCRGVAAALGTSPAAREKLPLWAVCDPDPTDLAHRQFLFQCTAAALRHVDWDAEDGKGLVELWLHQADGYLSALYHPQVLAQEKMWTALPGLHRCTLHVLHGNQVGEQGDELGYVRGLRAALEAAPAMKGAVEYLLAHPPKTEAQRQLEQLAQQVRTVLAQYAPDDPAVEALKSSPAYQRVSHLLLQ